MAKNELEPVKYIPYLTDDDKDKRSNYYGYEIPGHYYTYFGIREERSILQRFTDAFLEADDFIRGQDLPFYTDAPSSSPGIGVPAEIPAHYIKTADKFLASLLYEDMKGYRAYTGILPEVSFIAEEIGNYPQYDGNFRYGKLLELQKIYNNDYDYSNPSEHIEWNRKYSYSERRPENLLKQMNEIIDPINFFYNTDIEFDPDTGQFTVPDKDLKEMTKYYGDLEILRYLERVNKTRGLLGEYKSTSGGKAFEDILPIEYLGTPRSWDRDLQKPETVLLEALDLEDRTRYVDERTEYDKYDQYEPMWDRLKRWGSIAWKNASQAELQRYQADVVVQDAQMEMFQNGWETVKRAGSIAWKNVSQAELQRHQSDVMVRDAQIDMLKGAWSTAWSNANQAELQRHQSDVMVRDAQIDMLKGAWKAIKSTGRTVLDNVNEYGDNQVKDLNRAKEIYNELKHQNGGVSRGEFRNKLKEEGISPSIAGRYRRLFKYSDENRNPARTSAVSVKPVSYNANQGRQAVTVSRTPVKPANSGVSSSKNTSSQEVFSTLIKEFQPIFKHMQYASKNSQQAAKRQDGNSKGNTAATSSNLRNSGNAVSSKSLKPQNTKTYITGGSLDYINSIKSPIEIEEDKIQMLKDVAEREYNLKYAQVTPQMTVQFGDVRETADVNNILVAIEQMTADALRSSLIGGL